jgi:histidine triad (HIT) family protein
MNDCVFCQIIAGTLPASSIYRDEDVIVFTDVRQPTEAHVLVVPIQHVETLDALPLSLAAKLMQTAVLVARAIYASFQPEGLSLWQSNGLAAGQEVPHVHLHLLTRQLNDDLLRVYSAKPLRPSRETLDELAETIRRSFPLS